MASADDRSGSVLVWFEDSLPGRAALAQAHALARLRDLHLAVVTVATRERVIGCGRCLQGTVLWNLEMKKIAAEELLQARRILDGDDDVSYELVVGEPADALGAAAMHASAEVVVLPWQRRGRLAPRGRRQLGAQLRSSGSWQVLVGADGTSGGENTRGEG